MLRIKIMKLQSEKLKYAKYPIILSNEKHIIAKNIAFLFCKHFAKKKLSKKLVYQTITYKLGEALSYTLVILICQYLGESLFLSSESSSSIVYLILSILQQHIP